MSVSKLLSRPAGNCQDALLLLWGGRARLLGCSETSRPAVQEQRGPLAVHTTVTLVICWSFAVLLLCGRGYKSRSEVDVFPMFAPACVFLCLSFEKERSLYSDLVSCLIFSASLKPWLILTRLNGLVCVYLPKRNVSCKKGHGNSS